MLLARVLREVGRTLLVVGVLVLAFVAYQLWGTGIYEAQAQEDLRAELRDATSTTSTTSGGSTTTTTSPPVTLAVAGGEAMGTIRIPAIGVDKVFVEGTEVADLRKGPGHYTSTAQPGERGNVGIAGHRTTYGAPFGDLDQLVEGDEIVLTTAAGEFRYLVDDAIVVTPDRVDVLDPTPEGQLTLTTCHPKYSASQRLVVRAHLETPATASTPTSAPTTEDVPALESDDAGLGGERAALAAAGVWGMLAAVMWLASWWVARTVGGWRRWAVYGGASPAFLLAILVAFEQLNSYLPTNL